MMLGTSSAEAAAAGTTATAATTAITEAPHDSGGSGEVGGASGGIPISGFSEDDKGRIEEGERSAGGNRWPRQETLALLKIRSDMDGVFRDSSLKGPLWEEVSRKMAELGYQRSSKKCKEKFENVFKYHKRTKEGRASKADGKAYRFFDQLEALENNPSMQLPPPPRPQPPMVVAVEATMAVPMQASSNPPVPSQGTVSSAPLSPNPVSFAQNFVTQNVGNNAMPSLPPSQSQQLPPPPTTNATNPPPHHPSNVTTFPHLSTSMLSNSSSSSTSSDEEIGRRHTRKRKWKDFFERLMKNVIDKQEDLQKKFLDALERRERDRMIREEAWRVQEMARMNREHDLLVQERSMAAAKDAAVISFLQKVTGQQNQQNLNVTTADPIQLPVQLQLQENPIPPRPPPPAVTPLSIPQATPTTKVPPPASVAATAIVAPTPPPRNVESNTPSKTDNGIQNFNQPSSSRWPKAEVQALINLRTSLDIKYQENGPKGPLWEEISAGMQKLGYNRNAKRCKEKWENINKYFKKVKEGSKKRPEDSKTCPYFHQLDALYKEKAKTDTTTTTTTTTTINVNPMVPIMARPEQQWPIQLQEQQQHQDSAMEEHGSDHMDENDHEEDDGDDDDEEDEGGGYEIVTNKQASSTVE